LNNPPCLFQKGRKKGRKISFSELCERGRFQTRKDGESILSEILRRVRQAICMGAEDQTFCDPWFTRPFAGRLLLHAWLLAACQRLLPDLLVFS
jgi:hypothetical protein